MVVALREKLKSTEGEVIKLQGVVSESTQLQQKITQLESRLNGMVLSGIRGLILYW
jgi:hypothetical protein